jgi:tRNA threonylcarbamoyladenosine modification (KEOPS) complex  Pcc1 subunit
MHRATLRIKEAPWIGDAIKPEISEDMERSAMFLRYEGDETIIDVKAEDITALKASLSSALRYVAAASSALESIEKEK